MKLERLGGNRAVTPFFECFGGRLKVPPGDAVRLTETPANHRAEWRVLAVLVPLVLGAALADGLWRLGGPWLAVLGTLPALLGALHVFSWTLGGDRPAVQYRRWELVLTLWALVLLLGRWGGGAVGVAWLWLAFMALQMAGVVGLLWRRLMEAPGRRGVAIRWCLALLLHAAMVVLGWRWGWEWGAAVGALIALLWCGGTLWPASPWFGPVATRTEENEPLLTFDDGPDPADTPAILDLLDRHGRKAVFFVIGDKVRRYPELGREIVRRGHELGNHTMTHPQGTMWCAGAARTRQEIEGCSRVIEEVTGVKPRWFRAPVGHRNFFTHPVTAELGMDVVAWTRRAYDTVGSDVPAMVRALTRGAGPGDILLLHESTPVAVELATAVLEELEKCRVSGASEQ